ncbi:hypothetical protein CHM34_08330 [Paludifilum halophilum]|uniref:Uncharacterized protein n=1 Tax=Paludifilum halophilum TaxID=1642702 RepID=A0A235B732_9BACL|nr:hypothetical protein CHM34_08330 [Paludifilum halophilum]
MAHPLAYRYFHSEWLKLRWSMIIPIFILGPAISLWIGFAVPAKNDDRSSPPTGFPDRTRPSRFLYTWKAVFYANDIKTDKL